MGVEYLDKKNIAIIISKLNGGGAERVASNLSIELSEYYKVFLILFDGQNQVYPYGGELINLDIIPQRRVLKKLINLFKRILEIRRIKKEKKISCSISLMDGPNLVNVFSKRKDKVITSVRNYMSESKKNNLRISKFIMKLIELGSDQIVSLSKTVKLDLINNFKLNESKIIPIYNSCNIERLLELSKENKSEIKGDTSLSVVTMGRLTYQKGHWHLIRAFKKVLENVPNAMLYVLGEGELLNNLREQSKNLGIDSKVIFLGFVKNPHEFISKCNVFVFPSLYEGLGNVLLEALACGKTCISTDCNAGPREILAPKTNLERKTKTIEEAEYGILVPVCDGKNRGASEPLSTNELLLSEAIIKVLKNRNLREVYEKRALIRSQDFTSSKITESWLNVINSLIGSK